MRTSKNWTLRPNRERKAIIGAKDGTKSLNLGRNKRIFKVKKTFNFMKRQDRQVLYLIIGFFGGLMLMGTMLPVDYQFRTLFTVIGGIVVAVIGYNIATR